MPTRVVHVNFARRLERERDEAIRQRDETNESSVFSCNFYYEEKLKAERERDEVRESLASREVVIAQQNVITDLILECNTALEALMKIKAARWHTACELRRLATQALGSKK